MALTLEQAKNWLRVDGADEDALITSLIDLSESWLMDNIDGYADKIANTRFASKADMIRLLFVNDMYSNREMVGKDDQKLTLSVKSLLTQLVHGVYQ